MGLSFTIHPLPKKFHSVRSADLLAYRIFTNETMVFKTPESVIIERFDYQTPADYGGFILGC